jgi:hypothetical protein
MTAIQRALRNRRAAERAAKIRAEHSQPVTRTDDVELAAGDYVDAQKCRVVDCNGELGGYTGQQMVQAFIAGQTLSGGREVERLREALEWYAEQSEGCRKIGSVGDPHRQALARDGGQRARAALTVAKNTGEKK